MDSKIEKNELDPVEIAEEACGFDNETGEPRSRIYVFLSKFDFKNKTEKTIYLLSVRDACIDFDFDESEMKIYIMFKTKSSPDMRMITRAFKEYEDMLLSYVPGKEVPDFSLYIVPKKYKSKIAISANLPIDFNIISEAAEEFPNMLMFSFEYDTTFINEIPDADEDKWDEEIKAEEEQDKQREAEIEKKKEERKLIELQRVQRLIDNHKDRM